MYRKYYKFRENPFNVTADPSFFFFSKGHAEAVSSLYYGIEQRKGIITITGEVGTGKTTVCRALLHALDKSTKTAFVLNPRFSDLDMLRFIVSDLGISGEFDDRFELISALNRFLLKESSRGNNVVIIIDEAQNLTVSQLEQIRLLSNLETEKQKLLQIVLSGQPELDAKLSLPELRQLNQRVIVRANIKPLQLVEMVQYINHRVKRCAKRRVFSQDRLQFTSEAVLNIFKYTKGIPRLVNILCDRALLAGYVLETHTINKQIIHRSAKEVLVHEHNP